MSTLIGKRIVVAEDNGITVMQLQRGLALAGLCVVGVATSGEAAILLALQERPDLVLLDIDLRGTVNGIDVSRAILAVYRPCVVILTAFDNEYYRSQASELAVCGYLVKPVSTEGVLVGLYGAFTRWQGDTSELLQ